MRKRDYKGLCFVILGVAISALAAEEPAEITVDQLAAYNQATGAVKQAQKNLDVAQESLQAALQRQSDVASQIRGVCGERGVIYDSVRGEKCGPAKEKGVTK